MTLISCSSSIGLKESEDRLDFDGDDIVIRVRSEITIIGIEFSDLCSDVAMVSEIGTNEGRKVGGRRARTSSKENHRE